MMPRAAAAAVSSAPIVSVVIPARNEERDIDRCLAAVAAQDYDPARLEVIVVVGASEDGTEWRAREAIARLGLSRAKVIVNPVATTPSNLNRGLEAATGDVLCRVDARSLIPSDYVSRCASVLSTMPEVAVTGGAQVAVPPTADASGLGIARALNNKWAMGLSRYRRGAASGPADTVYLGAFRTADLRAAGGWDERLATNQDFELNRRMSRRGVVWFDAELSVGYVPRSNAGDLFRQYRRFGRWKVRYWRITGDRPRGRQLALIVAPLAAAGTVAACFVRRPQAGVAAVAGALASAAVLEVTGSPEPRTPSLAAHARSLVAMGAVGTGWLLGIAEEAIGGPSR